MSEWDDAEKKSYAEVSHGEEVNASYLPPDLP